MEDERVDPGEVEIRALSALLRAGTHHLELAVLSSAVEDASGAADRRNTIPLRGLPLQLR